MRCDWPWKLAPLWNSARLVRDVAALWTVDPWKLASLGNPTAPPWEDVAPKRSDPPRAAANPTAPRCPVPPKRVAATAFPAPERAVVVRAETRAVLKRAPMAGLA